MLSEAYIFFSLCCVCARACRHKNRKTADEKLASLGLGANVCYDVLYESASNGIRKHRSLAVP